MLGIHILVVAGLIMYDFATGTQKQTPSTQKALADTNANTGASKPEGIPPTTGSSTVTDPRSDTPAISSPTVTSEPAAPPLPYVAQPSAPAVRTTPAPVSGMPALSPGTHSRVDLEPVTASTVAVALPPPISAGAISQPAIDLPPPPPVQTPAPAPTVAKTTPPPVKAEPKKSVASTPPVSKKTTTTKPTTKSAAAPAKARTSSHTVSRGDTLGAIAKRYGVSVSSLVRANKLKNPDQVILGSRLVIP
jgi:LysM repeat protein